MFMHGGAGETGLAGSCCCVLWSVCMETLFPLAVPPCTVPSPLTERLSSRLPAPITLFVPPCFLCVWRDGGGVLAVRCEVVDQAPLCRAVTCSCLPCVCVVACCTLCPPVWSGHPQHVAAAAELQALVALRAAVVEAEAIAAAPREGGALDEGTYDQLGWTLGFSLTSSTKDRLARALDGTVDTLCFAMGGLTAEEAACLASALTTNTRLRSLDLGWCGLDVRATKCLAQALKDNPALTTLRLHNNPEVGDEGVAHISGALKRHGTLTALDLASVALSASSAEFLGVGVARSPCLRALTLSHNALLDEGVGALLGRACLSLSLHSLDLTGVGLTDRGALAVGAFLKRNTSLTHLCLAGNRLL